MKFYLNDSLYVTDTSAPYETTVQFYNYNPNTLRAVATDNLGGTAEQSISIQATQRPTVAITEPTTSYTVTAPAMIHFTATANDPDGTVSKVDFLVNNVVRGTVTTAPYVFDLNITAAGTYSVQAMATDNDGVTATSPTIITIYANANTPPTASFLSPTDGSTYSAGTSIFMQVKTTDSEYNQDKVIFYANGVQIAEDHEQAFLYTWENPPAGVYTLTAKVIDTVGAEGMSPSITITVRPNVPPTIGDHLAAFRRHLHQRRLDPGVDLCR